MLFAMNNAQVEIFLCVMFLKMENSSLSKNFKMTSSFKTSIADWEYGKLFEFSYADDNYSYQVNWHWDQTYTLYISTNKNAMKANFVED